MSFARRSKRPSWPRRDPRPRLDQPTGSSSSPVDHSATGSYTMVEPARSPTQPVTRRVPFGNETAPSSLRLPRHCTLPPQIPATSSSPKTLRRQVATRPLSTSRAGKRSCAAAIPSSFLWTCVNMAAARSMRPTNAIASAPGSSLTTQPCPPCHADAPRIMSTRPCVAPAQEHASPGAPKPVNILGSSRRL